jgi:hypothetical protein
MNALTEYVLKTLTEILLKSGVPDEATARSAAEAAIAEHGGGVLAAGRAVAAELAALDALRQAADAPPDLQRRLRSQAASLGRTARRTAKAPAIAKPSAPPKPTNGWIGAMRATAARMQSNPAATETDRMWIAALTSAAGELSATANPVASSA